MVEAADDKAVKDSYESSVAFQADLHIANAVNFFQLGYSAKEGFDFLHQAAAMRYLTRQAPEQRFFKLAAQNVSIVKRHCRPFKAE